MFDAATDFIYVTGANIDADHPHGDLDRIRLQGIDLMPQRSATRDPLYGKDIAFLKEAAWERLLLYGSPILFSSTFTRKLSVVQLQEIAAMLSNAAQGIGDLYWIDPDLYVSEQPIADVSGYRYIDTLLGAARWQVPTQTTTYTFVTDITLRRSNVLNLFDTVAAMKRFVDWRGEEVLLPTGYQSNDGTHSIDYSSQAQGWIHASTVTYNANMESNGDGTYKITGYTKFYDAEWYATGGFVWQMPTPGYLVGKAKEVWVLLECDVHEEMSYDPSGSQSSFDRSRVERQTSEATVYRLVKCTLASSQTITAGGYLQIPSGDISPERVTLLQQANKSRWTGMPSPPQGALDSCTQTIWSYVVAVYPVWEIAHTAT